MKKIVEELKQLVALKKTTNVGDVVLIAAKEPKMLFYAYVNEVERDSSRKDEWWHVHLTLLSVPLQKITWTLRSEQMSGQEIFTMGGEERFLQAVDFGEKQAVPLNAGKKISMLKRVK
ncbi:MAG: hypothetical protein KJ630_16615 [Proteobacteria bacterium]|nr:hypothetical protein [Pseudomonadota bacterium]